MDLKLIQTIVDLWQRIINVGFQKLLKKHFVILHVEWKAFTDWGFSLLLSQGMVLFVAWAEGDWRFLTRGWFCLDLKTCLVNSGNVQHLYCCLHLSFHLILNLFHELDILLGLESLIFLVQDLNFLDLMLIELNFSLKVSILLFQVLNFLNNFFHFNLILFRRKFIINFKKFFLKLCDFVIDFLKNIFMNGVFFLKLQLGIKKLIIDLDKSLLIFLYPVFMLGFGIIERLKFIKNLTQLFLNLYNLTIRISLNLWNPGHHRWIIDLHLWKMLFEYLIMFIKSTVQEGKVIAEFQLGNWY